MFAALFFAAGSDGPFGSSKSGELRILDAAGAAVGEPDPLDPYPGFGFTPEGRLRDQTIAFWEDFHQEELTRECMEAAGFQYSEDATNSHEALVEVAAGLGVQPIYGSPEPGQLNSTFVASLSSEEADRYYLTVLGESRDSIEGIDEYGVLPAGADPNTFASGGCVGDAMEAIPGIWASKKALADELTEVREQASAAAAATYPACPARHGRVASSPDELEAAVASGDESAESVLTNCDGVWREAFGATETQLLRVLVARNSDYLESVRARYATALSTIRADSEFLGFLARALGRSIAGVFHAGFHGVCAAMIIGTAGDDSITGGPGSDCIDGRGGDDSIFGGDGDDHLIGGVGNDSISGGAGDDYIEGGDDSDSLLGDSGADEIEGGDGANSCLVDADDSFVDGC
ncbi:MAG: calcium-binding protein [bacterium]